MSLFNPTRNYEVSHEFFLESVLGQVYEPNAPMGNRAQWDLAAVIEHWLIGLHREVASVIPRSLQWIDKAIANDEKFGVPEHPNWHRVTLHKAKAIGGWLEDGSNDEGAWDDARVYLEASWRDNPRVWSTHEIVKNGLDEYMAFAYLGGEHNEGFEAGIEMYERWTGKTGVSLSKALKPRDFGYALCLHRLARQQFDEDALFKAGRKILRAHLQEMWLGGGQYIRAATWLKIVYELHDPDLSPLQIILKAYDDMPDVPRPAFVPEV